MSGHTPGPWWLHVEHSTIYVEGKARDERVTQEVAAVGPKEGGKEQQAADARLIAAAPDLLEVLQQVETFTAYASCDNCREMHLIARAAIAKATGEAA